MTNEMGGGGVRRHPNDSRVGAAPCGRGPRIHAVTTPRRTAGRGPDPTCGHGLHARTRRVRRQENQLTEDVADLCGAPTRRGKLCRYPASECPWHGVERCGKATKAGNPCRASRQGCTWHAPRCGQPTPKGPCRFLPEVCPEHGDGPVPERRTCPQCGGTFVAFRGSNRANCSRGCLRQAWRARHTKE